MVRKILLVCGILSSLLYIAMNVCVPLQWESYSSASQTVSELSAIGAPTRQLWLWLVVPYTLLTAAFGWGVWLAAGRNRPLRVVGGLMIANAGIGLFWPPMHLRGAEFTLTDTLHIVFTIVTILIFMLEMVIAAAAMGKRFRLFTVGTMLCLVAFGVMTGLDGPRIAANLPTPRVGVWERISIGAFLLWILVFAIALLRVQVSAPEDNLSGRNDEGELGLSARHAV